MRLLIGLGNPGEKYKGNRHNVGHMVVEVLLEKGAKKNLIAKKSDVFINNSGELVKKILDRYKLKAADLWVIHDDLDIPLGSYKIQKGKGPRLHNGINSIEEVLGSEDFWRVRVGVDNRNPEDRISGEEYVLQDFGAEEAKLLKPVIDQICKKLATS